MKLRGGSSPFRRFKKEEIEDIRGFQVTERSGRQRHTLLGYYYEVFGSGQYARPVATGTTSTSNTYSFTWDSSST